MTDDLPLDEIRRSISMPAKPRYSDEDILKRSEEKEILNADDHFDSHESFFVQDKLKSDDWIGSTIELNIDFKKTDLYDDRLRKRTCRVVEKNDSENVQFREILEKL